MVFNMTKPLPARKWFTLIFHNTPGGTALFQTTAIAEQSLATAVAGSQNLGYVCPLILASFIRTCILDWQCSRVVGVTTIQGIINVIFLRKTIASDLKLSDQLCNDVQG